MTTTEMPTFTKLIEALADVARAEGRFKSVDIRDGMLCCAAAASAEPADYRVELDEGKAWVSLVMKDRWQSESVVVCDHCFEGCRFMFYRTNVISRYYSTTAPRLLSRSARQCPNQIKKPGASLPK